MSKTFRIAATAALLVILGSPAWAQRVDVKLEVDRRCDPGAKDAPCDILATVVSGKAPPPLDKVELVETGGKKGDIAIPASELKTFVQGDETLGIAVVFETQHIWLGNDTWWEPPRDMRTKTEGYYKPLTAALDKLNQAGPPGSQGALIAYGQGAAVKWKGELKDLTGDKIGTQKELTATATQVTDVNPSGLQPVVGMDVAPAIDEAIGALNKMGVTRKVLVLIGDGNGSETLGDYKRTLGNADITCFAIGLQAIQDLPGDENGWKKLGCKETKWLGAPDGLGPAMGLVVDGVADRYYLRFPGADLKLKKSFTWDDNPHSFLIRGIDQRDVELNEELALTPKWVPPWMRAKKGSGLWWKILLGVLGGLVLLVVGVKVLGGRKKEAPAPVVVAPPPVAAPPPAAPAPAGPMKTVMIGVGGDDQGFPIVGWIVPLNGPNQFQTFKLQPGATKIGTGGASHIVINDGFMSTEHAQIVMSPAGFTLVDGGSTNGTMVNERRVDKHELVDNDVFMMGKTNFRFKSIN